MPTTRRWSESINPASDPNHAVDTALRRALDDYQPPSFPEVLSRALSKLRDPEVPLAQVGALLASDPRLTIKLLSLVNSPAYGFRSPVLGVEHAVSLLGRAQVEALLLSMGVRNALPRKGGERLDIQRFWQAAARRAVVARTLAKALGEPNDGAVFTACLLQDMAIPVLSAHAGQVYDGLMEAWLAAGEDLATLEDSEFGWNHADVAGWLCDRWRFPEELTGAIGGHHRGHRTYSSRPPPPVEMVACLREGDGEYGEDEFIETTSQRTGLHADRLRDMLAESQVEARSVANTYL